MWGYYPLSDGQLSTCSSGVEDEFQHGRGVALADFDGDGRMDIAYGNWNGPHRLFMQGPHHGFRVRRERTRQ